MVNERIVFLTHDRNRLTKRLDVTNGTEKGKFKVFMFLIILIYLRGTIINRDLRYTQKPFYFLMFTNNIWSCLLRSPVIIRSRQACRFTGLEEIFDTTAATRRKPTTTASRGGQHHDQTSTGMEERHARGLVLPRFMIALARLLSRLLHVPSFARNHGTFGLLTGNNILGVPDAVHG